MAGNVLVKYAKIPTGDPALDAVQVQLVRVLNPVFDTETLGGNLLQNQSLKTGANSINHKLGRNLIGWQIVRQRAQASIWDMQDTNTTPALTLSLNTTADVVVDLYVF